MSRLLPCCCPFVTLASLPARVCARGRWSRSWSRRWFHSAVQVDMGPLKIKHLAILEWVPAEADKTIHSPSVFRDVCLMFFSAHAGAYRMVSLSPVISAGCCGRCGCLFCIDPPVGLFGLWLGFGLTDRDPTSVVPSVVPLHGFPFLCPCLSLSLPPSVSLFVSASVSLAVSVSFFLRLSVSLSLSLSLSLSVCVCVCVRVFIHLCPCPSLSQVQPLMMKYRNISLDFTLTDQKENERDIAELVALVSNMDTKVKASASVLAL